MDILQDWEAYSAIVKGKALRKLRLDVGFKTQKAFAAHCGIAHSYVNEIESGKKDIQWKELGKILHATQTARSSFQEYLDAEYAIAMATNKSTDVFVLRKADLYELESMVPGVLFRKIMKKLEPHKMGINAYKRLFNDVIQEDEKPMSTQKDTAQTQQPIKGKLALLWQMLSDPEILKAAADATVTTDFNGHESDGVVEQRV